VSVRNELLALLRRMNVLKSELTGKYLKMFLFLEFLFILSITFFIELKALVPKDHVAFSSKLENTSGQSVKEIKIETSVKNEQVIVKKENVDIKSENIILPKDIKSENTLQKDIKSGNVTPQKDIKSENEDEQDVKVDVTSSPTGYVAFKHYNYICNYLVMRLFLDKVF
jgi:hypothetical protein